MANAPIQMFVSSPSDAGIERNEIEQIVRRLNSLSKWRNAPPLQILRWPEDILPGAGSDLQNVINDQIGEFDIFVGIMRSRFGTPTPRSGSGTEEEIDRALEQHQRGKRPIRIMLYFSNIPVRPFESDPQQLLLIHSLKERVESLGVLPFTYNDIEQFRRLAKSHIERAYHEVLHRKPLSDSTRYSVSSPLRQPIARRELALGDMHFKDSVTYPQWADPKYVSLAPYRGHALTLKGTFTSSCPYYRLGFKLKEAREPNFGPGNIQTAGQNLLLHIGKNTTSKDVFFTYYKSGIRLEKDRVFTALEDGQPLNLELRWGQEGLVELLANGQALAQTFFSVIGIPQLIVIGWGDEHHYECDLSNVTLVASRTEEV